MENVFHKKYLKPSHQNLPTASICCSFKLRLRQWHCYYLLPSPFLRLLLWLLVMLFSFSDIFAYLSIVTDTTIFILDITFIFLNSNMFWTSFSLFFLLHILHIHNSSENSCPCLTNFFKYQVIVFRLTFFVAHFAVHNFSAVNSRCIAF